MNVGSPGAERCWRQSFDEVTVQKERVLNGGFGTPFLIRVLYSVNFVPVVSGRTCTHSISGENEPLVTLHPCWVDEGLGVDCLGWVRKVAWRKVDERWKSGWDNRLPPKRTTHTRTTRRKQKRMDEWKVLRSEAAAVIMIWVISVMLDSDKSTRKWCLIVGLMYEYAN